MTPTKTILLAKTYHSTEFGERLTILHRMAKTVDVEIHDPEKGLRWHRWRRGVCAMYLRKAGPILLALLLAATGQGAITYTVQNRAMSISGHPELTVSASDFGPWNESIEWTDGVNSASSSLTSELTELGVVATAESLGTIATNTYMKVGFTLDQSARMLFSFETPDTAPSAWLRMMLGYANGTAVYVNEFGWNNVDGSRPGTGLIQVPAGYSQIEAYSQSPPGSNYTLLLVFANPGDVTLDGFVGQDDLNIILANWGGTGSWLKGSMNDDAFIGQDDLSILLSNWGESYSITVVPEPSAWWLAVAAAMMWAAWRVR